MKIIPSTEESRNKSGNDLPIPDAIASDPGKLGWMAGFPPPPDRRIYFFDGSFYQFPALRWSFSNMRQLMPTVNVSRGLEAPILFAREHSPHIDNLEFIPLGSHQPITWQESLAVNYTDGVVVLHKGCIVYERYFGALKEDGQHAAMSVTKSLIGTLGALMVAEGELDPNATITNYVPELKASGFGDATVRQVLDMTAAIKFSEDYSDPDAEIWSHADAGNPLPKPKGYRGPGSYFEFLQTVEKLGNHGEAFGCRTVNTDVLGWIIARVTGCSVAQVLSDRIWRHLDAEQDAYFNVDSIGTPFAGGGFNSGLRDLARFGEMMRKGGWFNGKQVLPEAVVDDIRRGGNQMVFAKAGYQLLKGWSYHNMWWITHNLHGAFCARGVHGQVLYIDPKAEMVIARFASHPSAHNAANDPTSLPAYHALALHLLDA